VSILDGWWDEAYNVNSGWAIGKGEEYGDEKYQDEVESHSLYDLLEKEIVPLFYTRGVDDLPRGWISKMKMAMTSIGPEFNTNRMVREYTESMYLPALDRFSNLSADAFKRSKQLSAWKMHVRDNWKSMRILEVFAENQEKLKVGDGLNVYANIDLGQLMPDDVSVELYYGNLNVHGEIETPRLILMKSSGETKGSVHKYSGTIALDTSGRLGHTVRILPRNADLDNPYKPGLILWANGVV
jgi:starch phosphorylase